jgi:hypothetical protein
VEGWMAGQILAKKRAMEGGNNFKLSNSFHYQIKIILFFQPASAATAG